MQTRLTVRTPARTIRRVEPVIESLTAHLRQRDLGGLLGVSLFGSTAAGGLRPDSDIDFLVLTRRSLSRTEREGLIDFLLGFSGRRATVTQGRPLEVTSLLLDDVVPWVYPPMCDFLYGEWLRDDVLTGLPKRHANPDLAVLITTARQHAIVLHGPPVETLLAPVPEGDLRRAILDSLTTLLADLAGDERNVLLTLARMLITVETGQIVPKDQAAVQLLARLSQRHRPALALAARAYLGEAVDVWTDLQQEARETAEYLSERIRARRQAAT